MTNTTMTDKGSKSKTNSSRKSAAKEKESENAGSTDVAFLYKTMLQRDPSKRRVKPVEKHLLQIHFGMSEDESSDSDFEFKPGAAASDDDLFSDDLEDAENQEDNERAKKGSDSDNESDSDDNSEEDSDESEGIPEDEEETTKAIEAPTPVNYPKSCCVCLSSSSDEDEIIECDGCGILVHEGCYGTIEDDSRSVHSDISTESTEPWFCDACKAGNTQPSCELCPNQFGIFKQTDTGRWVHLICALYVPAVAFGNTEKLTNVTLLEMPYTKWGSKECSLCDDDNFSYTGVTIGCDAGMCKSYFHVTCAQKQGLLSEADIHEEIADPFYAHCKMHGDKLVSKQKKRNYLTLSAHVNQFRENRHTKPVSQRTKRRLEHFNKKFREAEAKRPPAWVPPNKLPRALSSSASAVRSLMRKAELLGVASPRAQQAAAQPPVVKKSYVAPALSVEFAAYYEQRGEKINSLKKQNAESLKRNKSLQEQQKSLDNNIAQLRSSIKADQRTHEEMRLQGYQIFKCLSLISKDKIKIPEKYAQAVLLKSPPAGSARCSPVSCGICDSTTDQHLQAQCDQCSNHYHLACLDPPLIRMPKKSKSCGWVCSICDHKNQQPVETSEDRVDTEAPRRLRQSIKEPEKFISPELQLYLERSKHVGRPRKRRGVSRGHVPTDWSGAVSARRGPGRPPRRGRGGRGRPGRPSNTLPAADTGAETAEHSPPSYTYDDVITSPDESEDDESSEEEVTSSPAHPQDELETSLTPEPSSSSPAKVGRRPKILDTGVCKPCNTDCNGGNAVRCDECMQWYHFACLDPPVRKSPKHRGYQWYCDECEKSMEIMDAEGGEEVTMEICQGDDNVVSFSGDVVNV